MTELTEQTKAALEEIAQRRKAAGEALQTAIQVEVGNGRTLANEGLDSSGFMLVRHQSRVQNWEDERQVAATYYREIEEVVKRETGARRVFCNSHVCRDSASDQSKNLFASPPVPLVHNDFSGSYGESILESVCSNSEAQMSFGLVEKMLKAGVTADELRQSRIVVVNAWRSTTPYPLCSSPFAVCDARTVSPEDLVSHSIGGDSKGKGKLDFTQAKHSASHRWWWYPGMRADEVMLFTQFDSSTDRCTLHSAFTHPDSPADAPPRRSIEARILCLLPKQQPDCAALPGAGARARL